MSEVFEEASPEAAASSDTSTDQATASRERGSIRFPYFDLDEARALAQTVFEHGGSSIAMDQLAAHLGTTVTSSAFRGRIASAATYGVVETQRGAGRVVLSSLGRRVADPATAADGLVEAFLNVPLYRAVFDRFKGGKLPGESGLESEMIALGVPSKQAAKARQVMMRGAEVAGFFRHGRDRLVEPPRSNIVGEQASPPEDNGDRDDREQPQDRGIMTHPLIQGLLQVLPEPGEPFSHEERQRWLKTFEMNLAYIYREPAPVHPPVARPTESPNEQP